MKHAFRLPRPRCAALLALLLGLASMSEGVESVADSVTRLARFGFASSPSFSPDGERIAFISDLNGIPQAWVVPQAGGYPQLITAGEDPVQSVFWSPTDEKLLALSIAPGGGMNGQIYVVNVDGTGLHRLTAGQRDNNLLFGWARDGRAIRAGSNVRNPAAVEPYLIDPKARTMRPLAEASGVNTFEDVTQDGRHALVARLVSRGSNDLYLVDRETKKEVLLTPHEGPGRFSGALAPDGRTVYVLSNHDRDLAAFARVRLGESGSPGPIEILAARENAELDQMAVDKQASMAALVWSVGGKSELALVDLPSGKPRPAPQLPGDVVLTSPTFSRDGRRLAMTIMSPTARADIWVLDIETNQLRQITFSPRAGVDLAQLVRPSLVRYRGHDGLELSGWLYRPAGQRVPGPYVLDFHGGPEGQTRPVFRSDYQALLSQGIGIFAPNVRGSSGFGKRFVNLDNGPLRVDAVRDIRSSVDYLVAQRIADPKRIGITGISYGGYMTMAGVTEYPDLFAAGATVCGFVNFATFFQRTEPWMAAISTVEYGDPVKDAEMLRSLSPIHKLDRIRAAVLVQHGANDTNTPVVEAEQIVDNLRRRAVPVEYLLFPDEGHGFRKTSNRIKAEISLVEFFVKHLEPSQG